MITKSQIKQYQSLKQKKFRQKYGLFVVEGAKVVEETIQSEVEVECVLFSDPTSTVISQHPKAQAVEQKVIEQISSLKSPPPFLAICKSSFMLDAKDKTSGWIIALDGIRDPGNLGTMIRIADWYGVKQIWCSEDCTDVLNPKTLQATMGSFLRVGVHYGDLADKCTTSGLQTFAALMDGQSHQATQFPPSGILLIGSESNGISADLLQKLDLKPVTIPRIGKAESLNAGVACGILCDAILGGAS